MHHLQSFLCAVISTCVLFPHEVAKCSQLRLILDCFKEDNPQHFQHNLQVSPHAFDVLVSLIQDHPAFYNTSGNEQLPVSYQLTIALYRFGHYGNAASVESIAQWASCSAGTIFNITQCVISSFLPLHDQSIQWPNAQEKQDRKSTRLNSSHQIISYAVFCLKKKKK